MVNNVDISQCISRLSPGWHGQPGAATLALDDIERATQLALPFDFREFMKWSDGGEAKLPLIYLSFWPSSRIIDLNHDYQINHYLGNKVLAIGSDGGAICFILDYRTSSSPCFSSVNFGDLDPTEIKQIAPSFTDALDLALSGRLDDDSL